ncbi:protoheme IX farnesyltransferase [Egibacter rhizosphaerae]|uniref:Protoheme IX farnesyltransferase n=1 Tax=Egibacter rhizosphaerae TaxID=1670831 RepID=A0A411YKD0_9ACTN|nr:heme o synthase [Egibacter rhizosphaerae]QBI21646.1 protoheme IX farnesyltransferase [Egibacter rhizosphaerae]
MTAIASDAPPIGGRELARAYLALTKPRIIELLLVTTVPAMLVAERGWPGTGLVLATLVGGALAAGSANTFNCYVDRDIDRRMPRTAERPTATARITPNQALRFGILLGLASVAWFVATVHLLAATLALGAILFYVFVYTIALKRRTAQNIVIGGAAGCMPVLIGWSAVTGSVELPALVMFAIVFYWTPPHFWALALRHREEYAAAGVPMLPVVASSRETTRQILLYTVMTVCVTLMFGAAAQLGWLYMGASVVLGGWFLWSAWRLHRAPDRDGAMRLFKVSMQYLALLFVVMGVDAVVIV